MWVLDKLVKDLTYSGDLFGTRMALTYIINEMQVHPGIKIEARKRLSTLNYENLKFGYYTKAVGTNLRS